MLSFIVWREKRAELDQYKKAIDSIFNEETRRRESKIKISISKASNLGKEFLLAFKLNAINFFRVEKVTYSLCFYLYFLFAKERWGFFAVIVGENDGEK